MKTTQDPVLNRYFAEMSAYPLLTPAQERELAQSVTELEAALWVELLDFEPTSRAILDQLARDVAADKDTEFDRERVETLRSQLTKRTGRPEWVALVRQLGLDLRQADNDRKWTRAAVRLATSFDELTDGSQDAYAFYCQRVRRADRLQREAKERFVKSNLRLVLTVARRYSKTDSLIDLIQEGNIGLMKGVERFDHTRGWRFSTYGSWWIRHAISRARFEKGRTVRVPVHLQDSRAQMARIERNLVSTLGREPTREEIAREMRVPLEKVEAMMELGFSPMSLDKPLGEDGGAVLDTFAGNALSADDQIEATEWSEEVNRMLGQLPPKEAKILRMRYGIGAPDEHTLAEIGEQFGLSRERIRQLEAIALDKLRRSLRLRRRERDYV